METPLKQLTLRPIGIKLFQDVRLPSKANVCIVFRCNSNENKVTLPINSDSTTKLEYITLKGLESSPINIKVYSSDARTSSNLLGELNLLLGTLAQETRSHKEWKSLTKFGSKIGEILIEQQTEDKRESDESFYSSKSKPDPLSKDSESTKTIIPEGSQEQYKSMSLQNSQESPSLDQKQPSEVNLSEGGRNKLEATPSQGSDHFSTVSVEISTQKQNSVHIQVDDKVFKPFKGLEQLSNGGEFFKVPHSNQDIYLDVMEPQEKPAPKKPMGVAKWMIYISQLVNPSLNY